jgi:glycosyltransferase involved in cell wall biosynthesis
MYKRRLCQVCLYAHKKAQILYSKQLFLYIGTRLFPLHKSQILLLKEGKQNKMRVIVTGTRGIPFIQGGVETYCQALYPRLVLKGCDVTVITRTPYVKERKREYRGVKLVNLYVPRIQAVEAFIHTFISILYAWLKRYPIIHIHAIGPSVFAPLARFLGLKVVMTHHGQDYNRAKWGKFAREVLKTGERLGVKYSHRIVAISEGIRDFIRDKYGRIDTVLLPNGVILHERTEKTDYIETLGIKDKRYIIAVGRLVPEKGFHDLIQAYRILKKRSFDTKSIEAGDIKLVIAGDADHETPYSTELKHSARESGVILTGFIPWQLLQELYSHSSLFVLPSYHEGTSMALLEALSFGLDILTSDIPANTEVGLSEDSYFHAGDTLSLADKISQKLISGNRKNYFELLEKRYNWEVVASGMYGIFSDLSH